MSVSSPFIHRPIATSLLGIAVMLGGMLGYFWLPVSSLPQVDFPDHPGHHAAAGRQPGHHGGAGHGAARAAIRADPLALHHDLVELVRGQPDHAAVRLEPRHRFRRAGRAGRHQRGGLDAAANLPYPPIYSKVNPADAPIVTLALTSQHDLAAAAQRSCRQPARPAAERAHRRRTRHGRRADCGPAIRIQADLARLADYGISLEDLRNVILGANVAGAKGSLDGTHQSYTIAANDQIAAADAYRDVVVDLSQRRAGVPQGCRRRHRWPGEHQGGRLVSGRCLPSSSTSSASPAPT